MASISLNGRWDVMERPLSHGRSAVGDVMQSEADFKGCVPGDVNDALVQAGRMPEPLVGVNFRKFRWVQERSWWLRRRIFVPDSWSRLLRTELRLDGLDVHGDVWCNGTYLGSHGSVFYPYTADVSEVLRPGQENVILVRLTTGFDRMGSYPDFPLLESVPTEAARGYPERGDKRRIYLRKPAYVWGWDWGPRLPTCGITGDGSCLEGKQSLEIADTTLTTHWVEGGAEVTAAVAIEHGTAAATERCDVRFRMVAEDGDVFEVVERQALLASGRNYLSLTLHIPKPRLWWPNGSGGQHLYQAELEAVTTAGESCRSSLSYGMRRIERDTSPGQFGFCVNGKPLFLKGGNWIPSDSLYGRISDEKLKTLVKEAAAANFNCLRIWGGGLYERDAFYDACDTEGILVWQDFMSACAPLPAHEPWFQREFEAEAEYQIGRLRNRTCLLMWCGNNEVAAMLEGVGIKPWDDPGWQLYHRTLPQLVQHLSPQIPYWPTSPYGGRDSTGCPDEGDDHHWVVMKPEPKYWSAPFYWDEPERPIFNSEYGYGGPVSWESTCDYMGTDEPDIFSEVGREHTNAFYDIPRVRFSIQEHYCEPDNLPLEEFILYGGLCQGLNLGYSLESMRANNHTRGGLFWMYNDTWGENGWSIVDYYLRRKISYYNVKRCLAPRRLVLRPGGKAFGGSKDEILLLALNDGSRALDISVRCGYMDYQGDGAIDLETVHCTVPAHSKAIAAIIPRPEPELLRTGTVVAQPLGECAQYLDAAALRTGAFRSTGAGRADVHVSHRKRMGPDLAVTVDSSSFAHAVHFDVAADYRLSDHYFDLLPHQSKTVTIYGGADLEDEDLAPRHVFADAGRAVLDRP